MGSGEGILKDMGDVGKPLSKYVCIDESSWLRVTYRL